MVHLDLAFFLAERTVTRCCRIYGRGLQSSCGCGGMVAHEAQGKCRVNQVIWQVLPLGLGHISHEGLCVDRGLRRCCRRCSLQIAAGKENPQANQVMEVLIVVRFAEMPEEKLRVIWVQEKETLQAIEMVRVETIQAM